MSMLSRTLCIGVVAFLAPGLLGGCRSTGGHESPVAVAPAVERAVYEAVLRRVYILPKSDSVVLNSALQSWEAGSFGERPRAIPNDAWNSFIAAHGRTDSTMPRDLDLGLPVFWFTHSEVEGQPAGDNGPLGRWRAFRSRFPKSTGRISLSPIGFSRDGRTAVVAGTVASAPLSASNDYFILRRTPRGWRLIKTLNISIA